MDTKANSKSCQTSETELFPQVVTGFRDELRILPNIKDRSLCKNSQKLKSFTIFCKNLHLGCLIRFWMCFWRTNSYIFGLYVTQSNGSKHGWNISKHIALRLKFYVAASRALFAHLAPALFFSKGVFRTPSNF